MRILLAVDAPSSHLFLLPFGWADEGHEVTVVMDRPDGRFGHAREHRHDGVRQLVLDRRSRLLDAVDGSASGSTIKQLIARQDAIVVGGYSTRSGRAVLRSPRRHRPHTVLMAERPDHRTRGTRRVVRDRWIRLVLHRVDAVWSMSALGDRAFAALGRSPQVHVPYPVPLPPSGYHLDDSMSDVPSDSIHVVSVGKLTPRKRPDLVIAVVGELVRRGVPARATFVGDGELRERLQRDARGLEVSFTGYVDSATVQNFIAKADVLLHPTEFDGWGMAVVEGALHGKGVLTSPQCDAGSELAQVTPFVRLSELDPIAMADGVLALIDGLGTRQARRDSLHSAVNSVCGVETVIRRSLDSLRRDVVTT